MKKNAEKHEWDWPGKELPGWRVALEPKNAIMV
jgi:hypothetical protein